MTGTIIVSLILAAIVIAIIARLISNKKKGRSTCDCGGDCGACGHCSHAVPVKQKK